MQDTGERKQSLSANLLRQGNFLVWHRYYVYLFEKALRDECGYAGTQPVSNEIHTFARGPKGTNGLHSTGTTDAGTKILFLLLSSTGATPVLEETGRPARRCRSDKWRPRGRRSVSSEVASAAAAWVWAVVTVEAA